MCANRPRPAWLTAILPYYILTTVLVQCRYTTTVYYYFFCRLFNPGNLSLCDWMGWTVWNLLSPPSLPPLSALLRVRVCVSLHMDPDHVRFYVSSMKHYCILSVHISIYSRKYFHLELKSVFAYSLCRYILSGPVTTSPCGLILSCQSWVICEEKRGEGERRRKIR